MLVGRLISGDMLVVLSLYCISPSAAASTGIKRMYGILYGQPRGSAKNDKGFAPRTTEEVYGRADWTENENQQNDPDAEQKNSRYYRNRKLQRKKRSCYTRKAAVQ